MLATRATRLGNISWKRKPFFLTLDRSFQPLQTLQQFIRGLSLMMKDHNNSFFAYLPYFRTDKKKTGETSRNFL